MTTDKNENLIAEDIAEDLLYRTGRVHSTGHIEHAIDCFQLPHTVETQDGKRLLETEDDLRAVLVAVRRYFRKNDITDVVRTVVSAEFLERDLIGSTHVTRLMQGNRQFRAPFPVYSLLRRTGDSWRIASSIYAIVDAPEHNAALLLTQPKRRQKGGCGDASSRDDDQET